MEVVAIETCKSIEFFRKGCLDLLVEVLSVGQFYPSRRPRALGPKVHKVP